MSRKATPDGIAKRDRAFRHNSYLGFVARMDVSLNTIMKSDTTTEESKKLAWEMYCLNGKLRTSLKVRVD